MVAGTGQRVKSAQGAEASGAVQAWEAMKLRTCG